MKKILSAILAFLLPIVKQAVIEVAAEETQRLRRAQRPRYNRYDPDAPSTRTRYADRVRASLKADPDPFEKPWPDVVKAFENRESRADAGFHDVILVAFDIDSTSVEDVRLALGSLLPSGDQTYWVNNEGYMHIDAWWIADDNVGDITQDLDSAVFCKPGRQHTARSLLRSSGIAHS